MRLTISHLYPQEMNLYGDLGNIIALKTRAQKRGIDVKINNINKQDKLAPGNTDIYFFGGGQDKQQLEIANDLIENKKIGLLEDLNNNVPLLSICGGYQLLGRYYLDGTNQRSQGIGFFYIETVAPGTKVTQRCIGNIATEIIDKQTLSDIKKYYKNEDFKKPNTLVGFENHSGRTRLLDRKLTHLGKVKKGIGDSEQTGFEGLRIKNAFGTYMHGSFLPKNPHICDVLISLALANKYKQFNHLEPLDDQLEWQAHFKAYKLP